MESTTRSEKKSGDKKVPQDSVTMGLPQLNRNEDTMGRKKYTIEGQARHTHFTWEQRLQLQYHYTRANGYKKLRSALILVYRGQLCTRLRR